MDQDCFKNITREYGSLKAQHEEMRTGLKLVLCTVCPLSASHLSHGRFSGTVAASQQEFHKRPFSVT